MFLQHHHHHHHQLNISWFNWLSFSTSLSPCVFVCLCLFKSQIGAFSFFFLLGSFHLVFIYAADIHFLLFTMSHFFLTIWSMVFVARFFSIISYGCCCCDYFGVIVRCTQHWSVNVKRKRQQRQQQQCLMSFSIQIHRVWTVFLLLFGAPQTHSTHTLRPLTSFFLLHLISALSLSGPT